MPANHDCFRQNQFEKISCLKLRIIAEIQLRKGIVHENLRTSDMSDD